MLNILFVNLKCWFILIEVTHGFTSVQVITRIIHHAVP